MTSQSRSKNGCWTCREKKVRCGEERPKCYRCIRLARFCDYAPRPRKPYTRRRPRSKQSPCHPDHEASPLVLASPTHGELEQNHDGSDLAQPPTPEHQPLYSPPTNIESPGLTAVDERAIHCFRTTVSASIDTKDPEFSVPSVIYRLARTRPMIMHMVCALGHQELFYQSLERPTQGTEDLSPVQCTCPKGVEHYGTSMRLLARAVSLPVHDETSDLDGMLATLWLMVVYEQKFGDGCALGLMTHLQGAASILQLRLGNLRLLLEADFSDHEEKWHISPFAGRMIVWLAFLDSCAAFVNLGGDFNRALGAAMVNLAENEIASRLRGFVAIHRYSTTLSRVVWGSTYPQQQLLEDLENRSLFYLYGECGQMRYVLSQLEEQLSFSSTISSGSLSLSSTDAGVTKPILDPQAIARTLHDISQRYCDIFAVASHLKLNLQSAGERRKFIMNVRYVVPLYHATVLWYFRITKPKNPFKFQERQRKSFREIIELAYQAHVEEGEQAMTRIAWPLFIAGIEGDDPIHEEWVLQRFQHMRLQGENYRRALNALKFIQMEQRVQGHRVLLPKYFDQGILDRFVI